jgi:bacteriocin-like protein
MATQNTITETALGSVLTAVAGTELSDDDLAKVTGGASQVDDGPGTGSPPHI